MSTTRTVDHDGTRYVLRFPYDPDIVARVKALPGRRWKPDDRTWTAPISRELVELIRERDFATTDAAIAALMAPLPTEDRYVEQQGPRLIVRSPYNPELIARIRELPGRRWEPERRVWTVPLTSGTALRAVADDLGLAWRVHEHLEPAETPTVAMRRGRLLVRLGYDRDLMLQLREIPGSTWDRSEEAWSIPAESAIDLVEFVEQHHAHVEPSALDTLDTARTAWERIRASAATDAELDIPGLGGTLLPFQRAGVRYALEALGYAPTGDGTWTRPELAAAGHP